MRWRRLLQRKLATDPWPPCVDRCCNSARLTLSIATPLDFVPLVQCLSQPGPKVVVGVLDGGDAELEGGHYLLEGVHAFPHQASLRCLGIHYLLESDLENEQPLQQAVCEGPRRLRGPRGRLRGPRRVRGPRLVLLGARSLGARLGAPGARPRASAPLLGGQVLDPRTAGPGPRKLSSCA